MGTDAHPLRQLDGCMNTFSGKKLNLLDPKPDQIDIQDIACGLAYKGYFSGQTPAFFSIAQHCLMVANLIPLEYVNNRDVMLLALMHDASEAYTGDMIKPLKVHLPEFQKIENRLQTVINEKYGINWDLMDIVKPYDREAQETCYQAFYKGGFVSFLDPEEAKNLFLERFNQYNNL